jgi:hypothetical protein
MTGVFRNWLQAQWSAKKPLGVLCATLWSTPFAFFLSTFVTSFTTQNTLFFDTEEPREMVLQTGINMKEMEM